MKNKEIKELEKKFKHKIQRMRNNLQQLKERLYIEPTKSGNLNLNDNKIYFKSKSKLEVKNNNIFNNNNQKKVNNHKSKKI